MDPVLFISGFVVIALAARQAGDLLSRTGLPLITVFLFTGIAAGPFALNLITREAVAHLGFVDEIALGIIAFAAGGELHLKSLKRQLKRIAWITAGLVGSTFSLASLAFFALSGFIPFTADMPHGFRAGVAILAGAICVARSPSSAIAIVNELRARGPFTQTVMGVTVIMDGVVISLFAANSAIADALFSGLAVNLGFVLLLAAELGLSLSLGFVVAQMLSLVTAARLPGIMKVMFILTAGFLVFEFSALVRAQSHARLSFELLLEPLLICMVAGFLTANQPRIRNEFLTRVTQVGPPVYVAFFTLTGASLALDVLAQAWPIALGLFLVRTGAIFIGAFAGGMTAGMPARECRISGMAYITQAGVGLGLAREVAVEFPEWGMAFATIMVSVIFLNQVLGPPLFKTAIQLMGEAHPGADPPEVCGPRQVVIFGSSGQAVALSRSLAAQGWQATIAVPRTAPGACDRVTDSPCIPLPGLEEGDLRRAGADKALAVVAMLSDQQNLQICELAYEHFGTQTLVATLQERAASPKFRALGVLTVDPALAVVNLLDHFVRSPAAASLLMNLHQGQKIADVHMNNPRLAGLPLRDLPLPLETLVISVRRQDSLIIPHDFTCIETGDRITLLGSDVSLKAATLRFDSHKDAALADMVEKAVPRALGRKPLPREVNEVIQGNMPDNGKRFRNLVAACPVLDLKHETDEKDLFRSVAALLCSRVNMRPSDLTGLLAAREQEASTVLAPGLAVPHIIVNGRAMFDLVMVRATRGIWFDPEKPPVYAAFVLAGTRDERQFHLYALSAIAKTALDPGFKGKWLRARQTRTLRRIVASAGREN